MIVPGRPGPLVEPRASAPGADFEAGGFGAVEMVLAGGGAALLVAVLVAGLPGWLVIPAVACLALGVALPLQVAIVHRVRRRRQAPPSPGTPLDVTAQPVRRLVAAYERLARTATGGPLEAGHLALTEVADRLGGHAPQTPEDADYVTRRAEAVSTLADHAADGPLRDTPGEGDALTRITALLE